MTKKGTVQRVTTIGRSLESAHNYAKDLLRQHELQDWSVHWAVVLEEGDGGGVTRAFTKRVVFSGAYMAILTADQRRDAVRHEVAHAIVGVAVGHSAVWSEKFVELGGSGLASVEVSGQRYPWFGLCPDGHGFVSMQSPRETDYLCKDASHQEPVAVIRYKRNNRSYAFDPGVAMMAERYPEPGSVPSFSVGDEVRILPFGSDEYDHASLVITEVGDRDYVTRRLDTGEEVTVAHEGVEALAQECH